MIGGDFDKHADVSSEQLPAAEGNLSAYLQFGGYGLNLNLDRDDEEQRGMSGQTYEVISWKYSLSILCFKVQTEKKNFFNSSIFVHNVIFFEKFLHDHIKITANLQNNHHWEPPETRWTEFL